MTDKTTSTEIQRKEEKERRKRQAEMEKQKAKEEAKKKYLEEVDVIAEDWNAGRNFILYFF